jgi:sec-independent protein translocase protein TatA
MPFLGNIGPGELIIILVIALVIFGPGKLPEIGQSVGKGIREFRRAASDISDATHIDAPAAPAPGAQAPGAQTPVAPVPPPAAPATPAPAPPSASDPASSAVPPAPPSEAPPVSGTNQGSDDSGQPAA